MNYQRVPIAELGFTWKHIKGYWSVCRILYQGKPVAQGTYDEMVELLETILNGKESTTPVDLDFKPPDLVKK